MRVCSLTGNILHDVVYFRDAHFVIGEEDEKKTEEDDKIMSDPKYVTTSLGRVHETS